MTTLISKKTTIERIPMVLPKAKHCKNVSTYRSNIFIFLFFFFRSNISIFTMMTRKPLLTCYYKWVTQKAHKFVLTVYFVTPFEDIYGGKKFAISLSKSQQTATNWCYQTVIQISILIILVVILWCWRTYKNLFETTK